MPKENNVLSEEFKDATKKELERLSFSGRHLNRTPYQVAKEVDYLFQLISGDLINAWKSEVKTQVDAITGEPLHASRSAMKKCEYVLNEVKRIESTVKQQADEIRNDINRLLDIQLEISDPKQRSLVNTYRELLQAGIDSNVSPDKAAAAAARIIATANGESASAAKGADTKEVE